jgi:hypothetical protein
VMRRQPATRGRELERGFTVLIASTPHIPRSPTAAYYRERRGRFRCTIRDGDGVAAAPSRSSASPA